MYFVSYAAYVTLPFGEEFFKTAPTGADVTGAVELVFDTIFFWVGIVTYIISTYIKTVSESKTHNGEDKHNFRYFKRNEELVRCIGSSRELLARVNLSEDEFLCLTVLMFWTIGEQQW